jgi:hypothetical protein
MLIREAQYKVCGECGSREMLSQEAYGCEVCQKPCDPKSLTANGKFHNYLGVTVHNEGGKYRDLHFCSWACVFAGLPSVICNYFIMLPYISFDAETPEGQGAADFFAALQALPRVDVTGRVPESGS